MKLKLSGLKQSVKQLLLIIRRYSFVPAKQRGEPTIIIMFDNTMQHGGLLDRIKGIISAKLVADELGYQFGIYVETISFNLFKFLKPHSLEIQITKTQLIYNFWSSQPVLFYNVFKKDKAAILKLFRKKKLQYHFYCNVDVLKNFYPQHTEAELHNQWRTYFNQLFYFDSYFESIYQKLFAGTNPITGIHLRFQALLGDAVEDALILDNATKAQLLNACMHAIEKIIKSNDGHSFLIVSDSAIFLNTLKNKTITSASGIIMSEGAIGHIDYVHAEAVLQKALTDFYLLSKCTIVYQVLAPCMYNSQFSKYAAILSNAPYKNEKI